MTMKSVDLPHLRSVVLAGHAGGGKTTLAEQLLFKAGAIPRLGKVDDGTGAPRFRARGAEAARVAEPRRRHVRARWDTHLAGRHAGLSGLHRRHDRRLRRRRRALFVVDASAGMEAGLSRRSRSAGPPAGRRASSSTSPTARTPTRPPRSMPCARRSVTRSRPLQIAIGAAESFERLCRPRPPQGVPLGRHQGGRDPHPRRATVGGRPSAATSSSPRPRRPTTTSWSSTSRARRSPDPELEACLRKGVKESILAPVLVGSAPRASVSRAARRLHALPPSPADEAPVKAPDKGGATVEVPADEDGPLLVRSSRRPPTRSSAA